MKKEEFEDIVAQEFHNAIPDSFQEKIHNVAFLVEDEPSSEIRSSQHLSSKETLLGLYQGVPVTARGNYYGVGTTLPDTIILYRFSIEEEARELCGWNKSLFEDKLREVIRGTIWHEVAHHFGFNEREIRTRERKGGEK